MQDTGNLWLAKALWDLGAVQFGDFTLGRTTQHSPVYINLRLLISNPWALSEAAKVMHQDIRTRQSMRNAQVQPFARVCGIPFGGLHLATAFSLHSKSPMIYVHPAKGENGNRVFVEGRYEPNESVLLIDDLVTSGGSIIETAEFLRMNADLNVRDVVVLLDREEGAREQLHAQGYNLISILGLETMLTYLKASGLIEEELYDKSAEYIRGRRAERGG